jgi:hypothetical protein
LHDCSVTKTFMTLLFAIVPSFTAQADGPFLAAGIRSVTRIQHRYDLTSATRVLRLGYDPIRIDPGSILDRITKDRAGLRGIDPGSILS